LYTFKKNQDLNALRMKLSDADFKFARLLIEFNYLKNVGYAGYSSSSVATPSATKGVVERAYSTLGLPYGAGAQEIKNKFRMLIKKYHPDRNKSKDAVTKFKLINEAYVILKVR
jgi:DnaJ-class molecular chaperone